MLPVRAAGPGQIDVVIDYDLQPYDYLPIVPVVEAAGGIDHRLARQKLGLDSDGSVLATGGGEIHAKMLELLV